MPGIRAASILGCPAGHHHRGLLQILSNLANDYGDAVKGSDKPDRIGPLRGMQKGAITQAQMKRALILTVALICLSGLALLFLAWQTMADFIGFMVLGGLSIVAALPTPSALVLTATSAWRYLRAGVLRLA
ncbi:1,4-dihydroxy-2-naphthoate octaprenyltransferase [Klebsiella michiganensis]|nr:1,4-dihydroxy-2-naphthoate octaprenyltransferase [Klebsiella michiganensis]